MTCETFNVKIDEMQQYSCFAIVARLSSFDNAILQTDKWTVLLFPQHI